jgi:hypothetical protein
MVMGSLDNGNVSPGDKTVPTTSLVKLRKSFGGSKVVRTVNDSTTATALKPEASFPMAVKSDWDEAVLVALLGGVPKPEKLKKQSFKKVT